MLYQYQHVALGGTFDLLHKGHLVLLKTAFQKGRFVSIGITTDQFAKTFHKQPCENERERRKNLAAYLKANNWLKRSKIIALDDIYGTTLKDPTVEALIISKETAERANLINQKRQSRNLKKLKLVIFPQIMAQDGQKLSSGRIRGGQINRDGRSFILTLNQIANKSISQKTRVQLKKPLGSIVKITKIKTFKDHPFIAIGDVTTVTFLKIGITPTISVVDLKVSRLKQFNNLKELGFTQNHQTFAVKNPPGVISKQLVLTLSKAISQNLKNCIIQVGGEEDLATIPAILLSPLGKYIYYGQPRVGTVKVTVDEKIKKRILSFFREIKSVL